MKKAKMQLKRVLKKIKRIIKGILYRLSSFLEKIKRLFLFKPKLNTEFYNNIDTLIKDIPTSKELNYYQKIDIKIGIITDEYMYNYYKDAVNLIYIPYSNYKNVINNVDLVLFVSCWHGMDNDDWRGMTSDIGPNKVIEAFNYAKSKKKKVVFQTIEDPSNYEIYLPIAKHADYIFTTASELVEQYKKDTANNNVFFLDYGVNPIIHNPVGFKAFKDPNKVFFAGSWAPRYKERCEDAINLFDGVIKSNKRLIIADRNYNIRGYEYPSKYYPYIIPAIEHEKLQNVHKLFDWALNLNSIKYSPTMCAMRIYELQAIGNLLISNYSIAVNNKFPNVFIAKTSNEVANILNSYNELEIYKMQTDGIRNVMSNHTVFDKLMYIFKCINEEKYILKPKKLLVVCKKNTKEIKEKYDKQSFQYKDIIELKDLTKSIIKKYDYVTLMKPNINYERFYLEDMINAFKYTDADYIAVDSKIKDGKVIGINHNYIEEFNELGLCVFDKNKFDVLDVIKENYIKGHGYSIDPFQVSQINYKINDKPEISVVVPIYNNGKYLLNKCFHSLLRSSIFSKMEIILVDDGSTDQSTIDIVKELESKYSNVKTFFFNDGGSGTASRARNKGLELSTTKYITYLDPDNEAINDGYSKLYDIITTNDYDFVFGSIIKLSDAETVLSYYSDNKVIDNPRDELIKKNFKTNSIQACIIKKSLIIKHKINNPEGAAGQDSLFFQELMLNAKKVYYLNMPIHIYYAARNDSVVNSINHKFFSKFLIMEEYQVLKLKEYKIFEEYKERRFKYFLENWYYEKLKYIKDKKEYEKSLKIIKEIERLYE